jgi:hypothetical protein
MHSLSVHIIHCQCIFKSLIGLKIYISLNWYLIFSTCKPITRLHGWLCSEVILTFLVSLINKINLIGEHLILQVVLIDFGRSIELQLNYIELGVL